MLVGIYNVHVITSNLSLLLYYIHTHHNPIICTKLVTFLTIRSHLFYTYVYNCTEIINILTGTVTNNVENKIKE